MGAILFTIIIYQCVVIYFLGKGRIWNIKADSKNMQDSMKPLKEEKTSIMGKTKTVISHIKPNEDISSHKKIHINNDTILAENKENEDSKFSKVVDKNEIEDVFTNTPLDLEIEAEYLTDELIEVNSEDDIALNIDDKDAYVAKGLSYDELMLAKDYIKEKSKSGDKSRKDLLDSLQGTELIEQMQNQFIGAVSSSIDEAIRNNTPVKENGTELEDKYRNFKIEDLV